ncbi:uncharacterized protein GGS25DRAFT_245494 [Hypoxylon fragiforme]|uniref:uncharacterized protein n=1 Tax=Hypoxylon fragiforme TaxID=63214 RepID=UPI0020C60FA2|nr:uncharacterized protein GGS25DRAFT_245494 [Hypoxylon fragiforme]KAI2610096.1 hypothetical protein GGS25DRAFT_245494 [Hypoxylon fragiforme]
MTSIRDLLRPADNETSTGKRARDADADTDAMDIGATAETTHFTIEFILDIICPYCYIALKNLDAAIEIYTARHPEATFEITCSPFLLDPIAARSAYEKSTYLNARTHSPEHWARLGEPVGINFSWEGLTGSTRDAHKLLRFALESTPTTARSTAFTSTPSRSAQGSPSSVSTRASKSPRPSPSPSPSFTTTTPPSETYRRGPALQLQLLRALLRAHHEQDGDISSRSFLTRTCASATGFSRSSITAVLASEKWGRAVDKLCAAVMSRRDVGVRAVPTLVVNGRYIIGGAQSADFLARELERIGRGGR